MSSCSAEIFKISNLNSVSCLDLQALFTFRFTGIVRKQLAKCCGTYRFTTCPTVGFGFSLGLSIDLAN